MRHRNNHSSRPAGGKHDHPLPGEISKKQKEETAAAHNEADRDMAEDPDLSAHSPNDDLDEGESARLGEDKTDLV